jgi:hypothetical protein
MCLSSVLAATCAASYPAAPSKPTVIGLQVHYPGAMGRIRPGSGYSFTAYSLDQDGAYELVTAKATWTSSDANVMRPSSTAWAFLAAGPGVARITARYEGLAASLSMVVIDPQLLQPLPRLTIFPAGPGAVGRAARPTAFLEQRADPTRATVTDRVTWTSADPQVATIDQSGLIRAIAPGTTLITGSLDGLTDWFWVSIAPN